MLHSPLILTADTALFLGHEPLRVPTSYDPNPLEQHFPDLWSCSHNVTVQGLIILKEDTASFGMLREFQEPGPLRVYALPLNLLFVYKRMLHSPLILTADTALFLGHEPLRVPTSYDPNPLEQHFPRLWSCSHNVTVQGRITLKEDTASFGMLREFQ